MTDWRSAFDSAMPEGVRPGPELNERLTRYWSDRKNWVFAAAKPVPLDRYEPSRALMEGYVEALVANGQCVQARRIAESTPPHFSEADIASIREKYGALKARCAGSAP